ncbi:MAG TPA: hypothetical protein VJ738_10215 [Steroidobacteraceae bacterium]|nr:hypothetical protein [Steroidobacteraceae bacterium]
MFHHPIIRFRAAVAAVAALAVCASASAFTPPPFPRLGGIDMGGAANYNDTTYQHELAKLSLMILKYTPGYAPGGESMDSIIAAIKAKNPNALVFLYTNSDGQTLTGTDTRQSLRDKINNMHWWLYPTMSTTDPVPSFYGHSEYTINNTPYTQKDSNGDDSIDWITKWYVNNYYKPNPDIDGFFMDNVFPQPKVAGEWTRNGTLLQPTNSKASAALQAGYERWFQLAHELMPGKFQIGNLGSWGRGNTSIPSGYQNMVDGGVLEAMIGESYSVEAWGGWQAMMTQYDKVMQIVRQPKLVIFNQWGSPTDYQSFRYGFASCLMNDAYYSFTNSSAGYYGVVWFDEYAAKLGAATSTPPTSAWQNGVWRRDFVNGIALVNPKGNGAQTVKLGGSFVKVKGSQDPSVNNGATVTSVTLKDRDGIILLRQSPLEQPKAPTGVSAGTG